MSFRWITRPTEVLDQSYREYQQDVLNGTQSVCIETALEIETWMKENARWRDRTGEARHTLYAEVQQLSRSIVIAIGHGVSYGFWLETIQSGRFSILRPALDRFAPILFGKVHAVMNNPRSGASYRYNITGGRIRRI